MNSVTLGPGLADLDLILDGPATRVTYVPTPPDLAFRSVDTRDASGADVISTAGRSFEGQCARKDDAN